MDAHQLYLAFTTEFPYISVDEKTIEDYVKQNPQVINSTKDLNLLKDYILFQGPEDQDRIIMKGLTPEAFLKALKICQGYSPVKIALNFNPDANHITSNHALVILEGNARLIKHLIKEGYSLNLKSWGLIVSRI